MPNLNQTPQAPKNYFLVVIAAAFNINNILANKDQNKNKAINSQLQQLSEEGVTAFKEETDPKKQLKIYKRYLKKTANILIKSGLASTYKEAFKMLEAAIFDFSWHPRTEFESEITENNNAIKIKERPIVHMTEKQKREIICILYAPYSKNLTPPAWYKNLSILQQKLLLKKLAPLKETIENEMRKNNMSLSTPALLANANIEKAFAKCFSGLSSLHRYYPTLPNASFEKVTLGTGFSFEQLIRSSLFVPTGMKDPENSAKENLAQLIENFAIQKIKKGDIKDGNKVDLDILFQTLLSPLKTDKTLGPLFYAGDNNTAMLDIKNKVIQQFKETYADGYLFSYNGKSYQINIHHIININHPINEMRDSVLSSHNKEEEEKQALEIITLALEDLALEKNNKINNINKLDLNYLDNLILNPPQKELLKQAVQQYVKLFQAPTHPETQILKAAFEMIIMQCLTNGAVQSSCKSGKDREGMMLMYYNALLFYFKKHGEFPDFKNKKMREEFFKIFPDLLAHHAAHASQNSCSLEALKSLKGVLSKDAIQELGLDAVSEHQKIAGLNRLKLTTDMKIEDFIDKLTKPITEELIKIIDKILYALGGRDEFSFIETEQDEEDIELSDVTILGKTEKKESVENNLFLQKFKKTLELKKELKNNKEKEASDNDQNLKNPQAIESDKELKKLKNRINEKEGDDKIESPVEVY